ncbi:Uma2 family endonuclease [Nocardia sp. NEAU-G5]|uniref:Uma2 family endonuclease n=1 Tax=Nocardia albiluteola TaxID=2842303 RepID=A0ABS6B1E3_9NOCA|nr:Uma2 family endonuclease [Nocardia albiluteola]MBU3064107.1 Uma2 family endonuclease [Nocardia albiluteola]
MAPTPYGRPITAEEFDTLRTDEPHRNEIENGLLLANGCLTPLRSRAISRLMVQLDSQAPPGLESFSGLEAELLGPSPRRVLDIVVAPVGVDEQARIRADQIVLAVEIATSGESAVRNFSVKAGEFAANGITHHWVIDILEPEPAGLTIYTLDTEGNYHIIPRAAGVVSVDAPFPLTIDLGALTARRSTQ